LNKANLLAHATRAIFKGEEMSTFLLSAIMIVAGLKVTILMGYFLLNIANLAR